VHLGFINGPFVPRNLILTQGSCVSCSSSRWPADLTFNVLWVQEKKPRYAVSFSVKSPSKRTPSRVPNRPPVERAVRLQGLFFLHISHIPHTKISLNKDMVCAKYDATTRFSRPLRQTRSEKPHHQLPPSARSPPKQAGKSHFHGPTTTRRLKRYHLADLPARF